MDHDALLRQLAELNRLRVEGGITEEEFASLKARLMSGQSSVQPRSRQEARTVSNARPQVNSRQVTSPASANSTVIEALHSDLLDAALASNAEFYRTRWLTFAERAKVSNSMIGGELEIRKMGLRQLSWNWPAFLFNIYWAVYRRVQYAWLALSIFLVGNILTAFIGTTGSVAFFVGSIVIMFVFGLLGNSLLMQSYLKNYAEGNLRVESHKSLPELFMAIGAAILVGIVSVLIEAIRTAR